MIFHLRPQLTLHFHAAKQNKNKNKNHSHRILYQPNSLNTLFAMKHGFIVLKTQPTKHNLNFSIKQTKSYAQTITLVLTENQTFLYAYMRKSQATMKFIISKFSKKPDMPTLLPKTSP